MSINQYLVYGAGYLGLLTAVLSYFVWESFLIAGGAGLAIFAGIIFLHVVFTGER